MAPGSGAELTGAMGSLRLGLQGERETGGKRPKQQQQKNGWAFPCVQASGCALLSLACVVEEEAEKEPYTHSHGQLDHLGSSQCGEHSPISLNFTVSLDWDSLRRRTKVPQWENVHFLSVPPLLLRSSPWLQ